MQGIAHSPPMREHTNANGQRVGKSGRLVTILLTVVAVFSVWMRAGFPVTAIRNSNADDALFLRLAHWISQGQWLGPFDNLTLVKGPVYPLFIAAAGMLHVPLKLMEQVCIVAASAALCRWIATREVRGCRSAVVRAVGCVLFVLLCLDPVVWTAPLERVAREGLYGSLSLAVVTFTLVVSFPSRLARLRDTLLSGITLGLISSAFWLTREEGFWLLPSAVAIISVAAAAEWAKWRNIRSRVTSPACPGSVLRRQVVSLGIAAIVYAVVIGTVATLDLRHYGEFELNEVKSSAFTHAYGALSRIEPDTWQRYIVFPKDVRTQTYAVSQAVRELAPTLDGPIGQNLAILRCREFGITPCIGFHAGWFQWVLRDAVATAGHYGSAAQSKAFYEQLAHEIDDACEAHKLHCLAARNTLAPPFRWDYVADALREAWPMFQLLAILGTTEIGSYPSAAAGGDLDAISDMVGPVQPGAAKTMILHGWAARPGRAPNVAIISHREAARFTSSVDLVPVGDIALGYPGLDDVEFTINTDCPRQDCDLILKVPGENDSKVPLATLSKGVTALDDQRILFVDRVDETPTFPFRTMLAQVQLILAKRLAVPYQAARFLWPVALASLVLAFVLDFRRVKPVPLYALALASLMAVVSRVGLLSYLEVTSIPSHNLLYLSPAMPFLIIFIVTALFLGARSVVCTMRERRAA